MNEEYQSEEECKHKAIKTITYVDGTIYRNYMLVEYCKDCDARIGEVR